MQLAQKVGRRIAENSNLKGLHRLDINDYLFTFFFIWCNNVVDYLLCLYNFIRSLVACNRRKVRGGDISHFGFLPSVRFSVS